MRTILATRSNVVIETNTYGAMREQNRELKAHMNAGGEPWQCHDGSLN